MIPGPITCWEFLWRGLEIEYSYNKEKFTYKIALSSRHVLSHRMLTQEEGRKGRSPRPKPFCYNTHSHYTIDARLGNALNRAPISTIKNPVSNFKFKISCFLYFRFLTNRTVQT